MQDSNALELLETITPPRPKRRFLQSWDRESRILWLGVGDDTRGVCVGSNREVEHAGPSRPTKLRKETAQVFLGGESAQSPFGEIQQILREYLYFGDERIYMLFAAWITGTYVYSLFSHFGYLFLHSQTPRCGKTRAEEVVSHLAFEATAPRNAPTPPSIRETAVEGGTAIFDTLERWREKGTDSFSAAMDLLDAGFRNGGHVTKMVQGPNGEWRSDSYPVYAPYMFAAINQRSLTDTARDRSFVIGMSRKNTRVKTRPFDARCESVCEPIRERLYLVAWTHANSIADIYESQKLAQHVNELGLNDRAADIWKPLLAVTLALDEHTMYQTLSQLAQEMSPDPDRQEETRQLEIVRALRAIAGRSGGAVSGTTQQIIRMLVKVTRFECSDLHGVLTGLGLSEKSMRLPGIETPRKAWELTDNQLGHIEGALLHNDGLPPELATTVTTAAPEGDASETSEPARQNDTPV